MINIYLFLLGLSVGSFLNVLIGRLPKGQKITGRSKCDHCRKKLGAWDLIPVISFLFLGGKCRYCHKKLSWQYPLVEILTGIIFFFVWKTVFVEDSLLIRASLLGIVSCLIVIFFADLKYQIIPDSIQIALFIFITIFNLKFLIFNQFSNFNFQILNYFAAALVVMLPILFLWAVTKGKGMGFGDVKLAANIGFLLGIKAGFLALYIAFIIGAVVGLILILLKKSKLKSRIAFGPFMVLGTLILIFYQKEIFGIIKQLYGF